MKRSQQTCVMGGLLICGLGLGLPKVSYAVTGCTNGYLSGTYTASVASANFLNVLNSINSAAAQANGTGTTSTGSGSTGSSGSGMSGSGGSTGSAGSSGTTGSGGIAQQPGQGSGGATTGSAGSGSGSTGSTGTSGGTTGSTGMSNIGFVNNPFSLGGATPGTSRFYFDGNGNIVGQNATSSSSGVAANAVVGSYSVSTDCTASMTLNTGAMFNAVVVSNGSQVLFMQNNAGQGGAVGALQRSSDVCLANSPTPQSFGFSFFGAQQIANTTSSSSSGTGGTGTSGTGASGSTGSSGTGGTGTTAGGTGNSGSSGGNTGASSGGTGNGAAGGSGSTGASGSGSTGTSGSGSTNTTANAVSFAPYGAIGELQLNGNGGFTMTEWIYQNGTSTKATASGNYTVGSDCSLALSFAAPNLSTLANGGTTGSTSIAPITAPVTFRGALVNAQTGVITIQPNTLSTITGTFVAQ